LFKYGFRVDYNLVKDIQCSYIKVESVIEGQNPTMNIMPWWYFPLLTAKSDHVITKGLNYILGRYASSIDTTAAPLSGVSRTVLLSTSDSSARIDNPVMINMEEVAQVPDKRTFNKSGLPLAILAEGVFESFYKNYGVPAGVSPANVEIRKESLPARIFLAGDGDLIRNDVTLSGSEPVPLPLGYDSDTRQTFGNKEFVMNVINYMTDDDGLISLRKREFKLRLLDRTKVRTSGQKMKWKLINTFAPFLIIVSFATLFSIIRKRKYGSKRI
jgi:ABC-2 type transport system permease protein